MESSPLIASLLAYLASQYLLGYLLFAMLIDWLLGLNAAWRNGEINSSIGRKGASTKAALLLGGVFFVGMEKLFQNIGLDAVAGMPIAETVLLFFIVNEVFSIVENLARCGVRIPGPVAAALEKVDTAKAPISQVKAIESIEREYPQVFKALVEKVAEEVAKGRARPGTDPGP